MRSDGRISRRRVRKTDLTCGKVEKWSGGSRELGKQTDRRKGKQKE